MLLLRRIRVLFALVKLAPREILSRANAVIAGMTDNAFFPSPPVSIAVFKAAVESFSSAIAASLDGGKQDLVARNSQGEVVVEMLRQLGHYVEASCKNDMATFISSGFQPVSTVRRVTPPLSESIRRIDQGSNSGQLLVGLVAVSGALIYELRWAPVVAGVTAAEWTSRPLHKTRPSVSIVGLTPGTVYAFQVRLLGKSGYSDWSDSVTQMCL